MTGHNSTENIFAYQYYDKVYSEELRVLGQVSHSNSIDFRYFSIWWFNDDYEGVVQKQPKMIIFR